MGIDPCPVGVYGGGSSSSPIGGTVTTFCPVELTESEIEINLKILKQTEFQVSLNWIMLRVFRLSTLPLYDQDFKN